MYSKTTVGRSIDRWVAAGGFEPVYRSPADCERGVAHFNTLFEIDPETGKAIATRDTNKRIEETLTAEEIRWIRNERLLCRIDFIYWVTRYCWIKNEQDRVVRFEPWASQEILLSIISEMEEKLWAIMLIILKARQLGTSRLLTLIDLHRVIFQPNRNAFLASSTEEKTGLLFDMIDFVLDRLPWWMRPEEKFRRENRFLEFMNGSALTLQHGQQSTGIARGTTPTVAHISELAEFTDPSSLIDSALLRAMHDSPDTFLTLEGTAEGINNWWHHKWLSAKAGWPEHRSRLRPLFLPWFVGGLYPKPDWLRAHPIPADYSSRMLPWAKAHAEMAEAYVQSTDYLSKHLSSKWRMPIEQIWFYECERDGAIRERRLNKFLQEMPANDDEAFQSTNVSVFDNETLVFYRDHAHRIPLAGCYGLRGRVEHIPARLQPSPMLIDPDKEPILVRADWGAGRPLDFELVPLRFYGWSLEDDSGSVDKIYLWEQPRHGFTYGLGVDTSDGIDRDRTVIEIVRKGGIYGPTKQVGEYASGKMNALDSWPFMMALGTYYAVEDEQGARRQPRIAIECRGHGDQPQNILRMLGWSNFHPWNDKNLDSRNPKLHQYNKLGVFTNSWFRSGMIEMIVKMLRDCEIEICSPFFVREMQSLEGNEDVQDLRAAYGGHDDRFMALGFILVSLYRWDMNYFRDARIAAYSGRVSDPERRAQKEYANWEYSWQERTDQGIYLP